VAPQETDDTGAANAEVVREVLELVHHHPGRIRVRADVFRAGSDAEDRVVAAAAAMRALPGVTRFDHNRRTGSVLIEYQPGLAQPGEILARLADAAGVAPCGDEALARTRTPALVAVGAMQELNAIAGELTGQKADLRTLIPAGLAALSAYSLLTGKDPMPRWDNLLWWSYSVFLHHHGREIEVSSEERRLARLERGRVEQASSAPRASST
jgi:hypothetical protein